MKKLKMLVGLGLIIGLMLSGCQKLPINLTWLRASSPTPTISSDTPGEETITPEVTVTAEVTPSPITILTVWVPPEMDPSLETESSQLFARQLASFSAAHDSLEITVRVKAASGVSGLLDSLTATSAAAPQSLPDLIALSRPDMEMAALKGLIFPLERFTEIPDDSNWYGFTREMALLQGSTFGLPFAADSLAIVYRPANVPGFTGVFADLVETQNQLTFPAGSDLSIYQLALYLSEGGQVQDNQRRPKLDVDPLTNVFRLMQEGVGGGVFSPEFIDFQNDNQVWETFRDGQTHMVVTWVSNYLQNGPADARLIPLLSNADNPITIGTGMSWSVATPNESRQQLAVELAEYLVAPDYLHAWSLAAGYIPSRPSAMENWPDQGLRATISQIALTTYLHPSNDIMTSIGPVLREGTIQVLRDMMDPSQAASVAVETLED